MDDLLAGVNRHLEATIQQLSDKKLHSGLQNALHYHDESKLPVTSTADLANRSIDLLHQLETLLEPGHLILANHFPGYFRQPYGEPSDIRITSMIGYFNAKCLVAVVDLELPINCRIKTQ